MNKPANPCEQTRNAGTDFRYSTSETNFYESPTTRLNHSDRRQPGSRPASESQSGSRSSEHDLLHSADLNV
jgi:hypothetical protein